MNQAITSHSSQTKRGSIRCSFNASVLRFLFAVAVCMLWNIMILVQESFRNVERALALYPQHTESLELLEMLKKKLAR